MCVWSNISPDQCPGQSGQGGQGGQVDQVHGGQDRCRAAMTAKNHPATSDQHHHHASTAAASAKVSEAT